MKQIDFWLFWRNPTIRGYLTFRTRFRMDLAWSRPSGTYVSS